MRSRLLTDIASVVLAGIGAGPATERRELRPPADLNPARASSGNKARLLERYLRRQRRLGGADHA